MSSKIAWKQNILVTDFHLLKSLLVVFGFGSQAFICEFSRQNICSVQLALVWKVWKVYNWGINLCLEKGQAKIQVRVKPDNFPRFNQPGF